MNGNCLLWKKLSLTSTALQMQGNKYFLSIPYWFAFDLENVKYSFAPVAIPRTTLAALENGIKFYI